VSDRSGREDLYARPLPGDAEFRLTWLDEPPRDPAISPDGARVAFAVGGRVAVVDVVTHDVRYLTLGLDYVDASPGWHPDGRRLVVAGRRRVGEATDLYELPTDGEGPESPRRALLESPASESEPVYSPDGASVVFVREDALFSLDLGSGRARRLTGGFRRFRQPRFLPSGRLLCLWSEEKRYGIDLLHPDGTERRTLTEGSVRYERVAASPDGRYLVATEAYDLGFAPSEFLTRRGNARLWLLDARGGALAPLTGGYRHSTHSAVWGR
jgi:Tol biopolymer transport system component